MRRTDGRRRGRPLVAMLLLLLAGRVAAVEIAQVMPLVRDGQVLVSFRMTDAFTQEIEAAIQSGLNTTFMYEIELRRSASFWVDRTIATATVSANVRYDNLTRRYQVTRTQDGRVEEAHVTEDPQLVRTWMTEFDRLALFTASTLEPNAEYYVRVRARTRPSDTFFLLPWGRVAASAVAKFTFIP